jgi:hypothetical protein
MGVSTCDFCNGSCFHDPMTAAHRHLSIAG